MTIEKYVNIYRHHRLTPDEIRDKQLGLINAELPREDKHMRWEALERLRRQPETNVRTMRAPGS